MTGPLPGTKREKWQCSINLSALPVPSRDKEGPAFSFWFLPILRILLPDRLLNLGNLKS